MAAGFITSSWGYALVKTIGSYIFFFFAHAFALPVPSLRERVFGAIKYILLSKLFLEPKTIPRIENFSQDRCLRHHLVAPTMTKGDLGQGNTSGHQNFPRITSRTPLKKVMLVGSYIFSLKRCHDIF